MRRPLRRRSSLAVGIALVLVAGFEGSASAAAAGLQRVDAGTPTNSQNKSATVTCPAGKRVLGAGAGLEADAAQVAINDVVPDPTLTSVTAQALEDQNGAPGAWGAIADAICAPPPPGLERIVATSPTDSVNKTVTASCPAGKRLLGGGGEISAGGGQVVLEDIRLNNLASVTVQGVEDEDGTTGTWFARAFAICANQVAGLERVAATSPTNSSDKSAAADCPSGKGLLGAGAEITAAGGQVALSQISPGFTLGSETGDPPNRAFVGAFEDENGTASNWSVRAIAICAAVSQRVVGETEPSSPASQTANATCPSGTLVTGAGGDITGGVGQVLLAELFPSTTFVRVTGVEDETGFAGVWFPRAYAICATPLPGQAVVAVRSATNSVPKSTTVTCLPGTRVIGASGAIEAADGQVVLDKIEPNPGLTTVTAVAVEDETGTTGNWTLDALAVCADAPPGLELVTVERDADSDPGGVTATCPAGKNLLGTGAEIDGGAGQVFLDDVRPNAALTSTTVTGVEDETGTTAQWILTAHAICANP
jgi:hypothetical protein